MCHLIKQRQTSVRMRRLSQKKMNEIRREEPGTEDAIS